MEVVEVKYTTKTVKSPDIEALDRLRAFLGSVQEQLKGTEFDSLGQECTSVMQDLTFVEGYIRVLKQPSW